MTRGQVLDPITAPQSIFLSPSPTRSAPFAAFCPHPRPVTTCVVPIPTPLPYFLSPSPPRYCRVVQTRTPHSHAWRTRWIYFDTFVRMFWDFIRIYVNSFYFLHFVRNVIVLLIFNIALLDNNKYTSEYHIHLTTARCSLITKVHRHCQIPSTAGRVLGMRTWRLGCFPHSRCRWRHHYTIQWSRSQPVFPVLLRLTTGWPCYAANWAETASAIMPSRRRGVSA